MIFLINPKLSRGRRHIYMKFTVAQIAVYLAAFGIASLGGLAALLRGKQELTVRNVLATILYSGVIGLIVALMWYNYFEGSDNIPFLLAVSALAGIGGATVIDLIKVFLQGKLSVRITSIPDEDASDGHGRTKI